MHCVACCELSLEFWACLVFGLFCCSSFRLVLEFSLLFLFLAFALLVALGWGGAWLLLIGNLIPRRVVTFWTVFLILKLVFLLWYSIGIFAVLQLVLFLWYSIGTFGGSSLAWSDSWLVCSLVSFIGVKSSSLSPYAFCIAFVFYIMMYRLW